MGRVAFAKTPTQVGGPASRLGRRGWELGGDEEWMRHAELEIRPIFEKRGDRAPADFARRTAPLRKKLAGFGEVRQHESGITSCAAEGCGGHSERAAERAARSAF